MDHDQIFIRWSDHEPYLVIHRDGTTTTQLRPPPDLPVWCDHEGCVDEEGDATGCDGNGGRPVITHPPHPALVGHIATPVRRDPYRTTTTVDTGDRL